MTLGDNSGSRRAWWAILALGCPAILLAARAMAWAAEIAPAGPDGRLAGYIAGLTILILVGYSLYLCIKPALEKPDSGLGIAILILAGIWVVKQSVLPILPGFGVDVGSYQAWASRITELGPARMYQPGYFLDYPPGYLYALWAAGAIGRIAHAAGQGYRQLIESPALIADFLLALAVFAYVRRYASVAMAYAAMLMVALNPGLLYESVVWGQSDSVPTLLMFLSVVSIIDGEFELSWALAAIGTLAKPQVLLFLPVLGLWTLLRGDIESWWRAGLAFVATAVIGAMPFQLGHPWDWLPSLYYSTTAYYHETSVNAFNLMALIGGLRQPDTITILGISCFTLGMSLLVILYGFITWTLWRSPSVRNLFYCTFLVVFGSFMIAPRMHERYTYPALVFVIPLALEDPMMLAVLCAVSLTFLVNLAYVKHVLESSKIFLDAHDRIAMAIAGINMIAFGAAIGFGFQPESQEEQTPQIAEPREGIRSLIARIRAASSATAADPGTAEQTASAISWIRIDTIAIAALVAAAVATRFWRLGLPAEIVFDEVHFVGQARHYLHGEPFLDPHPPLAKLMIAAGIWLFGDHPASWRFANALTGTALVAITYLLGRRMFRSRLAAALAAAFVLCDGMFIVDSRIGVIDIVYVTFAALAYLLFFSFLDAADPLRRRRMLLWIGVALGLCLASKLYIPVVSVMLVTGFLIYAMWNTGDVLAPRSNRYDPNRYRRIGGALLLTGATCAGIYIVVFLPHFILGWWGGIADLFSYYGQVVWYEKSVSSATHPYAAPWWSWPLMLRPIAYWQNFPATGKVMTIWGGGNPASWWGALTAIVIVAVQAFERRSIWRPFVVIGYIGYLAIWFPIGRTLFLYHYMGSVYLAYLALGAVLAECWNEGGQPWEHLALLLTLAPVFILGLHGAWGVIGFVLLMAGYAAILLQHPSYCGKYTCAAFAAVSLVLFFYYYPIWIGLPIERAGYYARMWLQGPGLRSWI